MKDISYQILDILEKYGSGPDGIRKALGTEEEPEVLYALSPIREIYWSGMIGRRKDGFCRSGQTTAP